MKLKVVYDIIFCYKSLSKWIGPQGESDIKVQARMGDSLGIIGKRVYLEHPLRYSHKVYNDTLLHINIMLVKYKNLSCALGHVSNAMYYQTRKSLHRFYMYF